MSTTTPDVLSAEVSSTTDPVLVLAAEIDASRRENRPTSRQALAVLLHRGVALDLKRSAEIVDEYCDEHAAGIPMYLEAEFLPGYLKVVAILLVLAAICVYGFGVSLLNQQRLAWPILVFATVLLGLGGLSWAKSLEKAR